MRSFQRIRHLTFFLLLIHSLSIFAQDILIKNEDYWNYYDEGFLNNDWVTITDFSKWKNGISPLGYGDDQNATELFFGNNPERKHSSKYFTKKVFIKNAHLAYEFRLLRDDGAVVYINGKELFRDNMPNSSVTHKTLAISTVKSEVEHKYFQHFFDNSIFKEGENIIYVSVHQSNLDSSDCIFSLELIGHNNPEILSFVLENKNKANKELESEIQILNLKFENEKTLIKKESLENTKLSLQILVFVISTLLFLSLIGYYIVFQNYKKKSLGLEQQLNSLKSKSLNKEKKMITLSTNLLYHKQYFKEIKADLKGIKTEDRTLVKNINSQIDYVLEKDEDWKILKQHFNAVHDNFYDKLLAKHPLISETELRHCMFIKLHMQTKEISKILLIDPRSVQTARYRIKKKMNLDEDTDLRDYLINI